MGLVRIFNGYDQRNVETEPGMILSLGEVDHLFMSGDFTEVTFRDVSVPLWELGNSPQAAVYRKCHFEDIRPYSLRCGGALLEECIFENVRVKDWHFRQGTLRSCRFSGRSDATIWFGTPDAAHNGHNIFERNDFSNFDFRGNFAQRYGAEIDSNTFRLDNEGFLTLDRECVASRAKKIIEQEWPPGRERDRAVLRCEIVLEEVSDGQRHWYLSRPPRPAFDWEEFLDVVRRAQSECG